jgi:hypothetical protein
VLRDCQELKSATRFPCRSHPNFFCWASTASFFRRAPIADDKMCAQPPTVFTRVGETPQHDTFEYIRDAVSLGQKKGIVMISHERLEGWGMEAFAE